MPRAFRDLIVDEADRKPRYNLVDRSGAIVLYDVRVEIASEVLQDGDPFGALAANRTLILDDDGTPLLYIDAEGGTIVFRRGASAPAALKHGEIYVTNAGLVYVGNSSGKPERVDATAQAAAAMAQTTANTARTEAAAAQTAANNANANANARMPIAGGAFSGNVAAYGGNRAGANLRNIIVQDVNGNEVATSTIVMRRKG